MLVLTRKTQEAVIITAPDGTRWRLVVCDIDRGKVRLGFDFPAEYLIHREEIAPKAEGPVPQ